MNSTALTILIIVYTVIISITIYFFWRVLTTKPKSEPDSYTDNDDILLRQED